MIDRISFSALTDYYNCPYYYKLVHINKVAGFEGNIFTAFGSACHKTAEYLLKESEHKDPTFFDYSFIAQLASLPKKEIQGKKELIVEMRESGNNISKELNTSLQNYYGNYKILGQESQIIEQIPTSIYSIPVNFKGIIDLIVETEDKKIHIADFKSCSYGWNGRERGDKKKIYQLIYYKYFYGRKHNIDLDNIETDFILLKRTAKKDRVEPFRVSSKQKRVDNAMEYLRVALEGIGNNKFYKRKSRCQDCCLFGTKYCKGVKINLQ